MLNDRGRMDFTMGRKKNVTEMKDSSRLLANGKYEELSHYLNLQDLLWRLLSLATSQGLPKTKRSMQFIQSLLSFYSNIGWGFKCGKKKTPGMGQFEDQTCDIFFTNVWLWNKGLLCLDIRRPQQLMGINSRCLWRAGWSHGAPDPLPLVRWEQEALSLAVPLQRRRLWWNLRGARTSRLISTYF